MKKNNHSKEKEKAKEERYGKRELVTDICEE